MRIGYQRAARIIDDLERAGVLGPKNGSKPRELLIGREEE
jgi:S-DNA-T family DNA segregation ATPase FtsK/SpoIIIE